MIHTLSKLNNIVSHVVSVYFDQPRYHFLPTLEGFQLSRMTFDN